MQKQANQVFVSATDLTHFADCQHLTWLDRLNLDHPMEKAEDDEQAKLIQAKGFEHEEAFLDKLGEAHSKVVTISAKASLEERVASTRGAIADGAEVIYQATLVRGNLIGHADFLIHVGNNGKDGGGHQYEIVDTKLARSAKAKFILQLCFYSDLLRDVTGHLPIHTHVELGNGKRETFRVADYVYYYRHLLARMLAYTTTYATSEPPYPAPCEFCSLCHWRERCEAKRKTDDHLSAVANMTRQQISRLESAGVRMLGNAFFHDLIEEVKKGQRGADVVQTVRTPMGQICGKIIWEAKRAENWSDKWLQKLKDDQEAANADIAVIVTTAMPKGITDSFCRIGDVWVVSPQVMRPVAETLRVIVLEAQRLKLVNTGRNEKMEQLYNYLSSAQFAQKVRTMLEGFESMRRDLESEKRAMQRIWAKRQTQIERVTGSMVTVVGELQAIAQEQLPQLGSMLELEAIEDDVSTENA